MHMHVRMCMYTHTHTHKHTHTHMHICTHTHACIHTHITFGKIRGTRDTAYGETATSAPLFRSRTLIIREFTPPYTNRKRGHGASGYTGTRA